MRKSRNTILAALAVLLVIGVAVGSRVMVWSGGEHASGSAIGGPFTLVNGDGQTVTDADFRGRWALIYFGYTFCPDVCPTELSIMAGAMDKLTPQEQAKLAPLFISVDPTRDTPAVMKDYATAFHPKMIGLTGSPEQVAAVMKSYKVYAAKAKVEGNQDPTSYTVDHSSILYLIGPDGRFVAHFPHGTAVDDLASALKKHLK